MEEKEEGISLGEIFHVIFKRKWLLLGVTLAITFIGALFVLLIYNPLKTEYQSTFEIRFPASGSVANDTRRYPDGTEFLYQDLISLDHLQKAKEKDESLASVNIDKMKSKNDIYIQEYEYLVNEEPIKTGIYTISVLQKYFSSKEQARAFIVALTNVPVDMVLEKSKMRDYDRYLKQYYQVEDLVSQINVLIGQKDVIIDGYADLISHYSSAQSITLSNGKLLMISEAQSEIESYFKSYDLGAMKTEVEENGYVRPNSEYINTIKNRKVQLERELVENNMKLERLEEQIIKLSSSFPSQTLILQELETAISNLTIRNAEIVYTIENVYDRYLNFAENSHNEEELQKFEARLDAHYKKLQEFTETYTAFRNLMYEKNTKALISAGSIVVEEGGINIFIALAAFLVIGAILGCFLNLCLDLPKYLKEKKAAVSKEEQIEEATLKLE